MAKRMFTFHVEEQDYTPELAQEIQKVWGGWLKGRSFAEAGTIGGIWFTLRSRSYDDGRRSVVIKQASNVTGGHNFLEGEQ